jgi:hypothetical protein
MVAMAISWRSRGSILFAGMARATGAYRYAIISLVRVWLVPARRACNDDLAVR